MIRHLVSAVLVLVAHGQSIMFVNAGRSKIASSTMSSTMSSITSSITSSTTSSTTPSLCSVTAYTNVAAATASCTAITLDNIRVPSGSTLDLSKLNTGTTVTFAGNTTFDYYDGNINLIEIGGTDITVTSEPDAVIDGNGQSWWDGLGSNGGIAKPNHFVTLNKVHGTSVIKNLYIQNYPVHCFSISNCVNLTIENITLNNEAGNPPNNHSNGLAAAHNTDGFDISSSTNVVLKDSKVVNQDDCVAITSGDNIIVQNMYCNGGHGLSIGSVGGKSNNNVTNILFEDSVVLNSQNGARIKTNYNTTGYIAGITYKNIAVTNISIYGIDIQQDYLNGGPTGIHDLLNGEIKLTDTALEYADHHLPGIPSNGVIITNITMQNIIGTAQKDAQDYYILCGDGSCSDFTFKNIQITGGTNGSCNVNPAGNFNC